MTDTYIEAQMMASKYGFEVEFGNDGYKLKRGKAVYDWFISIDDLLTYLNNYNND